MLILIRTRFLLTVQSYNRADSETTHVYASMPHLWLLVQRLVIFMQLFFPMFYIVIGSLDTKTLCSVATPSVRPLHMDAARSDMGGHVPAHSSWRFSEPSTQISGVQSSSVPSAGPSDDKVPIEMARLRAENHALRNNCSMWRKRAEAHGEANLNLLKFARALRDQASQIARDRNELETRCFMLKKQLDGDCSYSNELSTSFFPFDRIH